ncbi:UV radiation resistance-associated gene protein isoform X2 [Serinus canaria]|uniref:UV radiation resistance-associated gene protein isoform X2 n=1 Tax=Serinus canaria TaxID=9135 RepID=UPI0008DB4DC0|nr:UV radiation resistance-associated gene protein isoform X2 [Serinus canaria]
MTSAAGPAALPPGSAARALHVELPSQQRRLRHLRNIAARNIINKNGHRLLDTYFTLHLCDNAKIYKEFYKSEVIKNSLNPTWRSLDFGIMPDRLDTSVSCFVVRIWGGKKEHFQLLIEWKVNLDGLKYLGQQIHARNPNEIIFGLNDGYYGASFEQKDHSGTLKNSLLQVDQNCVRNSYDVFSLLRLHRAQCAIKQTQVTVQKIGREIEEKLRCTSTRNELKKESECLQLKILVLRNELERQKKALGQEVALLHKQKSLLLDRENAFGTEYQKLEEHNESLYESRKECTAKREQFLKINAQQTIRCKQLLSELSYIYPIDLNNQKDYFVCGVKLPNSEDFQVPLRYPIIHKGSRSTIKDNINDKLTEKEREFPLYAKGGEKLQFEYGVYLLNKNIAQLRYQHGLSTPDLRQTLPNLKNFMELGLMVRCDRHHTSSAIPVPKRQSSSFGRLDIGFSSGLPSPDKGLRKRASTGSERLQYKTPPPSYNSALTQPVAVTACVGELDKKPGPICSSLDTSMDSSKRNTKKGQDLCSSLNGENGSLNNTQDRKESFLGRSSAINGAFLPGECSGTMNSEQPCEFQPPLNPVLCCTVEQAEEIMGMEATGFSAGDQLEDFTSIPVEHAVAVECDEQVLGEFEEFSRRICALNENMSSFRRPRKSSDK